MSSISRVYKLKLYKNAKHESNPSSIPTSSHGITNAIPPKGHPSRILGQHVSQRLGIMCLRKGTFKVILCRHNLVFSKAKYPIVENAACQDNLDLSLVSMEGFVVKHPKSVLECTTGPLHSHPK